MNGLLKAGVIAFGVVNAVGTVALLYKEYKDYKNGVGNYAKEVAEDIKDATANVKEATEKIKEGVTKIVGDKKEDIVYDEEGNEVEPKPKMTLLARAILAWRNMSNIYKVLIIYFVFRIVYLLGYKSGVDNAKEYFIPKMRVMAAIIAALEGEEEVANEC